MNTEFITKTGVKTGDAMVRHGNKAAHFVSLGMIAWLTATFAGKDSFADHCRQSEKAHDECAQKRARQWQKLADLELRLDRLEQRAIMSRPTAEWLPVPGDTLPDFNPYGGVVTPLGISAISTH